MFFRPLLTAVAALIFIVRTANASKKTTTPTTFTVGYLTGSRRRPGDLSYERPGLTISGAISLAVNEVNAANGTFGRRGHRLEFIVAETFGDERTSILQTAHLWTRNVSAYIGPQETCFHEGRMASSFNVPMISYFCTDHVTSNKDLFPTFARTRPPDTQISKSVASVLLHFNWTHVVFLYSKSSNREFEKIAKTILSTLNSAQIHVAAVRTWKEIYDHAYYENPFYSVLKDTFEDTRIYVILGYYYEHQKLLLAMEKMKLLEKGEYFVLGIDIEQYDAEDPFKYLRGFLRNDIVPAVERAYRSYLGVAPTPPMGFETFADQVNSYMEKPPFNYINVMTATGIKKKIRAEAAYLYDAIHLYTRAIVELMDAGEDPYNGTAVIDSIKGSRYASAMGYMVYMDNNGDAEGNYTLLARQPAQEVTARGHYGLYPVGMFALKSNYTKLPKLHLSGSINWVSGSPPVAVLKCGFRGEKCITHTSEIIGGVCGGGIFILLIVMLVFYRNWRYEQELDSLLWKIDYREIEIPEENAANSTIASNVNNANGATGALNDVTAGNNKNENQNNSRTYPLIRTSQVSLSSNPDADFRYSSIFTKIGIYKGRIYALKKVHKKSIDITREMKKELKMMRDLRHNNLNPFVGACTEPPNICIITEYCSRGSLRDILENEEVKLDNMFVASIVADILRGMMYLHDSAIKYHGALCTSNCLVDSRWVVKVADYGLREFKRGADESFKYADDPAQVLSKCESLLYKAPELLRGTGNANGDNTLPPPLGTQKGDVYSFSIILYELHSRHGPFGETGLTAPEILQRVIAHPTETNAPFRPNLESLENSFDFVRDCLKECWAEIPEERPDLKTVRTRLRPLRKGMKPNIFDNMMAMMEKYANNLEVLVDERTDQLQEEKKKTEALLLEMLPRPVAEQLKRGNKVEAESFDCVTIYFSDIVGFTSMSAESTPLQVVDFLNDLYTCFDSIIEHYDVYKVETIGDAYMVVSGLPIRNEDQHAAEIATMSLHLVSAVQQFTIRHRPAQKLMLRIGIHSGPVCAGVVGLKMPRYCLFGDTVNTASRMESTGEPLKIHCSQRCKDLLDKLGGYTFEDRGYVEMKGKGEQLTFWLIGEDIDKRNQRSEARCARRSQATGKPCRNGHVLDINGIPGIPRSSLKNKNILPRSPLPRCSSLESPKRLRFASVDRLELFPHITQRSSRDPLLEVIIDSPAKKSSGSLVEPSIDGGSEAFKTSSSSCPCIENIANSTATLAQCHLSMFPKDAEKLYCNSVPTLVLPPEEKKSYRVIKVCSAPSSPKRKGIRLNAISYSYSPLLSVTFNDASVPLLSSLTNEISGTDRDTPF